MKIDSGYNLSLFDDFVVKDRLALSLKKIYEKSFKGALNARRCPLPVARCSRAALRCARSAQRVSPAARGLRPVVLPDY